MKHSNHALRYVDLHPAPVKPEPSNLRIVAGAAVFMLGLCLIVSFCFSL